MTTKKPTKIWYISGKRYDNWLQAAVASQALDWAWDKLSDQERKDKIEKIKLSMTKNEWKVLNALKELGEKKQCR